MPKQPRKHQDVPSPGTVAHETAIHETPVIDAAVHEIGIQEATHENVLSTLDDVSSPPYNPTSLTRIESQAPLIRRPGQHLTDDDRAHVKAIFLAEFARMANVTAACELAGIDRSMVYDWLRDDAQFAEGWHNAEQQANDVLRREAWHRGVEGWQEPIVSMGKLVYGADGQPLTVTKYSDALLTTLMRARMAEFKESRQVDVTNTINVNQATAHSVTIDVRGMTPDELAEVRRIAERMKEREDARDNG